MKAAANRKNTSVFSADIVFALSMTTVTGQLAGVNDKCRIAPGPRCASVGVVGLQFRPGYFVQRVPAPASVTSWV